MAGRHHAVTGRAGTKAVVAVAALLLFPLTIDAQSVQGVVLDRETRTPVSRAIVSLLGASGAAGTTVTDSLGSFRLGPFTPGRYVIRGTHPAYAALLSDTLVVTDPDVPLTAEIRLARSGSPAGEVVVSTRTVLLDSLVVKARGATHLAGFRERMKSATAGQFVKRADIDARRGAAKATDLLREVAGVNILTRAAMACAPNAPTCTVPPNNPMWTNPRVQLITIGARQCQPIILVDGMEFVQHPDGSVDDVLNPSMLEGVEIYTNPASAPIELSRTTSCGVVAFWTRPHESGRVWSWTRLFAAVGTFAVMMLIAH